MADRKSINIRIKLDGKAEFKKELDKLIKESGANNLKFDTSSAIKSLNEFSKVLNDVGKKIQGSFNASQINSEVQAINKATEAQKKYNSTKSSSPKTESITNTFKDYGDGNGKQQVETVTKLNNGLGQTVKITQDLINNTERISDTTNFKSIDNINTKLQSGINKLQANDFLDESVIRDVQNRLNSINTNSSEAEVKQLAQEIKNLGSSDSQIVRVQNNLSKMKSGLDNMQGKYKGLVGDKDSIVQLEKYNSEIKKLERLLRDLQSGKTFTGEKISSELNKASEASRNLSNAVKNSSRALKLSQQDAQSFGSSINKAFNSVGIYMSAYQAIHLVFRSIKNGISTIVEMDTALADLNKVVDLTKSQLEGMRDSAVSLGKELGQSSKDVASAMAEFGRLYKDTDSIKEMTRVSVLGSNVMDNTTSAQVAKNLTTIMTAMKKEVGDSMSILDSMNEIQNNYRISADDMSNALSEVASTAYTSGVSLEQVEGYITAITVATGESGNEVGNALRSMMARVYKIGAEGIEAEGKPEKMLQEMGVAVRDSEGQFRDFGAIMDDLNGKWGNLTSTEKTATAQQVAGIQRYNQFISLMNNYQVAIDSTTTALNSQGSAVKENEIYMQSAQAKINQLKTTLQETAINFIDSDGVKVAIEGITKLVEAFDSLPLVIGVATTALLLFKGKAILGGTNAVIGYVSSLRSLAITEGLVATTTSELSLVFGKLTKTISANPLGALAVAFTVIIALSEKYKKTTKEVIENNKEMVESLNSQKDSINSSKQLLSEKEKLEKQINSTNEGTAENLSLKEKLLDVEKQLAKALPTTTTGFTEQGDAISENSEAVQAKIQAEETKMKQDLLEKTKEFNGLRFNIGRQFGGEENIGIDRLDKQKIILEENIKQMKLAINKGEKYVKLVKSINDDGSFEYYDSKDVTMSNGLNLVANNNRLEQLQDKMTELTSDNDTIKYYILQLKELGVENDVIIQKLGISSDTFSKLTEKIEDTTKKTKALTTEWTNLRKYDDTIDVEESQKSYADSIESIKQLTGWITSMNSESGYTSDIMLEMLKIYPEMSTYISDTARVQDFLNKKIAEQEETQKKVYLELMSKDAEFYSSKIKGTENWESIVAKSFELVGEISDAYYSDNITNMKNDLSNANDLAKARATLETNLIKALAQAWGKYYSTLASLTQNNIKAYDSHGQLNVNTNVMTEEDYGNMGGMEAFGKSLEQMNSERTANNKTIEDMSKGLADSYSAYAKGMKELENIGVDIDFLVPTPNLGGGGSTSGKDAVDYSVKSLESLRDAYQRLNAIIEETQHQLNILDKREQISYGYDKLDLMKKKIQFLEREQSLTNQLANTYRDEAQSQRNDLSSRGVQFDSEGLISNYNEILGAMRNSANSMSSYDDSSKKAKENAIENVKQLKESMESYSNTTIKGLRSAEVSWEELTNTIRDQYKEIVKLTATAEDKVSSIIQKEIEKRYDKRKEALDKQRKLYEDSYKDEDYEDNKAELEDKLQTINQDLISAMKAQNQSAIKELQEQKAEAIKELNNLVTDKERENASDIFDKALEDIDSQKEDMLKAENLTKMVTQAMQSGFINVNGEIISLSDSMDIFLKESTIGTANLRLQMDDLVTSIANGIAGLKDLGSYSAFLNSSNLVGDVLSKNVLSVTSNILPIKSNDSRVIYQAGDINISGSVTEEVFPKLKAEMQNIADGAVNKFVKYVNGQ